ncbi:hypothetical protein K461DRAFT_291151 [Myriangium duriaei CBS 260.36]|uniref:Cyclase n=1 Tax=Myriangium duriaei CBS 260.36 TaxID=1168546 RepID=A0A9P4MIP7_9PEZI|nr:hypothetical protein K461DRAFT_291151 [Myriangium duriaei CBS 260.36]
MAPTWNPDDTKFPSRHELPAIEGAPKYAAWFWGKDDNIGRLNLLTPSRVKEAATNIKTGEIVPVNLPLNVPEVPSFGREQFKHQIKTLEPGIAYDDLYTLNTQSGTQWDGFRHFAHLATQTFYNGTKGDDITGPNANHRCSLHHWAEHGIAGRGVLIDFASWAEKTGKKYDPYAHDEISYEDLAAAGKEQGIDIRPAAQGGDIHVGDMLFIRSGWIKAYYSKSKEERARLATRHSGLDEKSENVLAGVGQDDNILDWLHDCYFSTVGGDAPSFEAWPSFKGFFLHEYILALWGMPLGEMLDLEKLAETCKRHNRWFFFFTSSPANVPGGVGTHVNGQAIF